MIYVKDVLDDFLGYFVSLGACGRRKARRREAQFDGVQWTLVPCEIPRPNDGRLSDLPGLLAKLSLVSLWWSEVVDV